MLTLVPPLPSTPPVQLCGHTTHPGTLTWVCRLQPHPPTTPHALRSLR